MANVLILYGYQGYPEENWFPWLKAELEKLENKVVIPQLPGADKPDLQKWDTELSKYDYLFDENLIVIGYSLGVALGLRKLEKINKPILGFFSVAGFAEKLNQKYAHVTKTFVDKSFDWAKIKENCKNFFVFQSDNDSYVPYETGERLANNLGAELIFVLGAGHFNTKAGYTKFELLLEKIKGLVANK